ncbi:MAG TPA: carotenoid oxygenase family protein [Candidatus Babeliales bacterium]|nr:carotenoid oxygenase family protein [Candidatus Babeliales bacterium]
MLKKIAIFAALLFLIALGAILWHRRTIQQLQNHLQVTTESPLQIRTESIGDGQFESEIIRGDASIGFCSVACENPPICLPTKGTIPVWLHGFLLRTGPGLFEVGSDTFKYWFDGFALLQSFKFDKGTVQYASKFLKSDFYKGAMKSGKLPIQEEKKSSFFSKMGALLAKREPYDNGNINIMKIGNQFVALTESTFPVAFNPSTLETYQFADFDDDLDGHVVTPHPIIDPQTGNSFNVMTQFGTTSYYHVYYIQPNSTKRTIIASVEAKQPSYIHGLSVTQNYIVLTLTPFVVNPPDLLFSIKPFLDYFSWKPELGTTFIVIDRATGRTLDSIKTEPFFVLNQINAFEKNNELNLDMIIYPDAQIMKATTIENLRNRPESFGERSQLIRFSINLKNKNVAKNILSQNSVELPRINPLFKTKHYRYIYAMGAGFSSIQKVDTESERIIEWKANGCCPTEPVFIPRPHEKKEDDGVLITQVLDTINCKSFILILDAHNLHEIGRAVLPSIVPFSLHGLYTEA